MTFRQLVLYFLRLGALGFGGPIALANSMRRDLVEKRQALTEAEYEDGLAVAAACPGPLAYQLAVYIGYIRRGPAGALAVAVAFGLAPFLIVVAAAAAYTRAASSWQIRGLFYGVAPVVVALILKACWNLGKKTLRNDRVAWILSAAACAVTVVVEKELAVLFLMAGLLGAFLFAKPAAGPMASASGSSSLLSLPVSLPESTPAPPPASPQALAFVFGGLGGGMTSKLFLFFFKTGLFVFGSGLVIVPFLKSSVVDEYHWLSNRQFLDAVAIGMISPGPVVITATFVGYLLAGLKGALAATLGIFSPAVLFTILATPLLLRHRGSRRLTGFIRGVTVAVVGVLVGTTVLVGRTAVGDPLTGAIALLCLAVLALWPRVPEPLLVAAGALAGLAAYPR